MSGLDRAGFDHAVADYLATRRALGFELKRHGRLLPQLVAHLDRAAARTLTTSLALAWATNLPGHPDEWPVRLSIARGFARWLQALDPATEVPPTALLPRRRRRARPYVYTEADVVALMAATATLRFPFRSATYATLIGLLATTGIRVGEAIALDADDFDQEAGCLLVRGGKHSATRELPLHPSTSDALGAYAELRHRRWPHPKATAFLLSLAGTRLFYENVNSTFRLLLHQAGLPAEGTRRPRIHDLRHSFVQHTVTEWYQAGLDVTTRLPQLAAYLGHADPSGTYWYLSATPELLATAAARREPSRRPQR
jgi:integrase